MGARNLIEMTATFYFLIIATFFLSMLGIMLFYFRRKFNALYKATTSVDAAINSTHLLGFYKGFPISLDEWSLEANNLMEVFKSIMQIDKPVVLELGSGKSSVLISYFLCEFEIQGKLHSVEHDSIFLSSIEKIISLNRSAAFWQYHHVALKQTHDQGKVILSYPVETLRSIIKDIKPDIIIIDGPPVSLMLDNGERNTYARAFLDQVVKSIDPKPVIFIDDTQRLGEQLLIGKLVEAGYTKQEMPSKKGFVKLQ
jgi:hypothetical protein